jgi:hypothetical protein
MDQRHTSWVTAPILRGLRDGVTESEIADVVRQLPPGVSVTADFEVGALVIRWANDRSVGTQNTANDVLAASGHFVGGPGSEEAVRRYRPGDHVPSAGWAMWEAPDGGRNIMCERCRWSAHHEDPEEAEPDAVRHDHEVHGDP